MDFGYVTQYARSERELGTAQEILYFHYFNPNGMMEERRRINEAIDRAVAEGRAYEGAIYAYGSMDAHRDVEAEMRRLLSRSRVTKIQLQALLMMLQRRNENSRRFLNTIGAE